MSDPATVRLLFFSSLRDLTGVEEIDWPWPPADGGEPTVARLLREVWARWPALDAWEARLLVAVDLAFADRATVVRAGQELALMPPVQGG